MITWRYGHLHLSHLAWVRISTQLQRIIMMSRRHGEASMCAVPRMDVKLDVLSAGFSWRMFKTPQRPLQRVGKLLLAP